MAPSTSLFDQAMAASVARKKQTQNRTKVSLDNLMELVNSIPEPTVGGGGGSSPGGYGAGGKGTGPSSGAIPALESYSWRGMPLTTAKGTKKNFKGLLNDLSKEGYKISSLGSYSYRNARGSNRLSEHAYGKAIDINPGSNPMGSRLVTNMPKNINRLAKLHGLIWGGSWRSKKDPMHFSTTGY